MWEKEEMLVSKIFTFSNGVFKSFLVEGRLKLRSCDKGFLKEAVN